MKKTLIFIVTLVAGPLVLALAACSGHDAESGGMSDWVTFRSENVLVQLPAYFEGGDPRALGVLDELEKLASSCSNPDMSDSIRLRVQDLRSSVSEHPDDELIPELEMWSASNPGGKVAVVTVQRAIGQDGWVLQDYVDDISAWYPQSRSAVVAFQTKERAYVVAPSLPGDTWVKHCAVIMGFDQTTYYVTYMFDPALTALPEVFEASARTMSVVP